MTVSSKFFKYPVFGLPINGLAENEVITLPNGHKAEYPFTGTWSVLVRARNIGNRPPTDYAMQKFCRQQGYRFNDYALLTGMAREIGGVALGQQAWLYCDAKHAWKVRLDIATITGTNLVHLKLVLVNVFGLLAWNATPPSMPEERVLAEIIFPLRYRYMDARPDSLLCDMYCFMTHSQHGDVTAINLCASRDEVGDCSFQGPQFYYQFASTNGYEVHTVLQANISGLGSIVAGSVGRGIYGELHILGQPGDLTITTETVTADGNPLIEINPPWSFLGTYHRTTTTVTTQKYYAAATLAGSITWAQRQLTTVQEVYAENTRADDYSWYHRVYGTAYNMSASASFAGVGLAQTAAGGTETEAHYDASAILVWRTDTAQHETAGDAGSANSDVTGFYAGAAVLTMFSPDVFELVASGPPGGGARRIVAAQGHILTGYADVPGPSARLVAYNPATGDFAVAPTSSDLVQWV